MIASADVFLFSIRLAALVIKSSKSKRQSSGALEGEIVGFRD
jgi:hypothetical protein